MLAQKITNLLKIFFFSLLLLISSASPLYAAGAAEYIEAKKAPGMDLTKWTTGGPNFLGVLQIVGWGFIDESWGISEPTNTEGQLNGAIPTLLGFMGATYLQKPASVPQYLAYVQNRAGFPAKPVYAQGIGFKAMKPILSIWVLMRNICYLFFIIVFVAIGFMIMFRKKLNPQTVISIQNSLPNIILGLILVTFSFAISGLIIDLSELATRVIASLFKADYLQRIDDLIRSLTDPSFLPAGSNPQDYLSNFFSVTSKLFVVQEIADAIQETIKSISLGLGAGGTTIISVFSGVVVPLIFTIAILQTLIKGFFMLLTAYVNIVLSTIFSPFVFLANSFGPGATPQWFKGFLTNALVFPVTFALLIIATVIIAGTGNPDITARLSCPTGNCWNPTITPGSINSFEWFPAPLGIFWKKDPVSGDMVFSTDLINYLIAFGLLLAIPKVNDMIKGALEKRESGVGEGVSQTLMGAMRNIPLVGGLLSG